MLDLAEVLTLKHLHPQILSILVLLGPSLQAPHMPNLDLPDLSGLMGQLGGLLQLAGDGGAAAGGAGAGAAAAGATAPAVITSPVVTAPGRKMKQYEYFPFWNNIMMVNSDFLSHDSPGDLDDGGGAAWYRDRAPGRDRHSRDPGQQEAQEAPQPRRLQHLSPGWLWVWESQSKKILRTEESLDVSTSWCKNAIVIELNPSSICG